MGCFRHAFHWALPGGDHFVTTFLAMIVWEVIANEGCSCRSAATSNQDFTYLPKKLMQFTE